MTTSAAQARVSQQIASLACLLQIHTTATTIPIRSFMLFGIKSSILHSSLLTLFPPKEGGGADMEGLTTAVM